MTTYDIRHKPVFTDRDYEVFWLTLPSGRELQLGWFQLPDFERYVGLPEKLAAHQDGLVAALDDLVAAAVAAEREACAVCAEAGGSGDIAGAIRARRGTPDIPAPPDPSTPTVINPYGIGKNVPACTIVQTVVDSDGKTIHVSHIVVPLDPEAC